MTNGDPPTLGELSRRLDRLDADIRQVARDHVTEKLYLSEMGELRRDITNLKADRADDHKVARQARQFAISAVVIPLCIAAVTLFVAVMT